MTDWKVSSDAWKEACHKMHRRAQKAEGALQAARIILDDWEKTISHYDLPKHDLLVRTIKAQFGKALARAIPPEPVPATKPFTFADPTRQVEHERHRAQSRRERDDGYRG